MAFARDTYTATGGQTNFAITFSYITDPDHIDVYQNGTQLTHGAGNDFTISGGTTVVLNSGATSGDTVTIVRNTSRSTRLVDWSVPSAMTETDLDNDSLQAFYMSQEAIDTTSLALLKNAAATAFAGESLQIKSVADPTAAQDAATKAYVDSVFASGSAAGTLISLTVDGGTLTYNDSGGDYDARFEGDTDANLLFLDASTDRIGIGTATPSYKLHVAGTFGATGNVTLDGGTLTYNEAGADLDARFEGASDANLIYLDAGNDRVGIGTATPSVKLDVSGTITGTAIEGTPIGASTASAGTFTALTSNGIDDNATSNALTISSDEEVTMPAQPVFSVLPATAQNDIATGSDVTIVWGTEVTDIGGNFASNTFTAPVSGNYLLSVELQFNNWDSVAGQTALKIVTGNRTYTVACDPSRFSSDVSEWHMNACVVADMDALDTAHVTIKFAAGTAQTDVTANSRFTGALLA